MLQISVIVPVRNEAATIAACLASLLSQTLPAAEYEVLVVDGSSDDGSQKVACDLKQSAPNLRLLQNPNRIMPAAMNIGLANASANVVMVAGAHTTYPRDYLEKCLMYLRQTGADVVGGPLLTQPRGGGFVPRVIAAILSSRFGVGNAAFRTTLKEGFVDTVPYGAYRKEIFARCGEYNEALIRAQDCELHARIRHVGGRIYQTPELLTHYYPVATFPEFCRKAFFDGLWQMLAIRQNPRSLALRRLAPAFMVAVLAVLALGATLALWIRIVLYLFLVIYFLAGICFGPGRSVSVDILTRLSVPVLAFPFHLSYGLGTLAGLSDGMTSTRRDVSTGRQQTNRS